MPYDSHSDTIDEMKNRLERMESLLLAGTRSSLDDNRAGSSVRDANQDDASYCLMDRIGFSSFIGATILLLDPFARRKFTVSVRFRVRISLSYRRVVCGGFPASHTRPNCWTLFFNRERTCMLGWSEEMMSAWQLLRPDDQTPLPPRGSALLAVNC
jgi:hypothetical protein